MPTDLITDDYLKAIESDCQQTIYFRLPEFDGIRKSRFHTAIVYLLYAHQLSDEDITEQVETDSNDQGIDFFYISEDELPRVWVIQVKDHQVFQKAQQREAVLKMKNEIDDLLSRQRVNNAWPENRIDRFHSLKALRGADIQFKYVLLLTGGASAALSALDDFPVNTFDDTNETLQVIDRAGICELIQHAEQPQSLSAQLNIELKQAGVQLAKNGSPKYVFGLVQVSDYVAATRPLGDDLFALNPRLFLSATSGPNKEMMKTLQDPINRKFFHLLNNGITAVCRTLEIKTIANSHSVAKMDGLLVVNGCQTTETLWAWMKDPDVREEAKNVSVMIRIIESGENEELNRRISKTTNSQSAILSSDLVANDDIQKRLKSALSDSADKPIFYENRRGEWKKQPRHEKLMYVIPSGEFSDLGRQYRKITLRELGQALQSVTGLPEQAKEGITNLFKSGNRRYPEIFEDSWTESSQVQLVADLFRFVAQKSNWLTDMASEEERELAALGRFYITYLIYETWRGGGRPNFEAVPDDKLKLINAEESARLRENLKSEASPLANKAVRSLNRTLKNEANQIEGKRALLRQAINKKKIEEKFEDILIDS